MMWWPLVVINCIFLSYVYLFNLKQLADLRMKTQSIVSSIIDSNNDYWCFLLCTVFIWFGHNLIFWIMATCLVSIDSVFVHARTIHVTGHRFVLRINAIRKDSKRKLI